MTPKSERFEMRLDQNTIERVDDWRSNQSDLPSRAEAVRRLVESSLSDSIRDLPIRISDGERLIIAMMTDISKHLKIRGDLDTDFVQSALNGHSWGLKMEYGGMFHRHEDDERAVLEVMEILGMWDFIETAHKSLSKQDKILLEKSADPFGKTVKFPGFDGNNESEHLGIARFLIVDMKRFAAFKDRADLNSHCPMLDSYRRMLRAFGPMRLKLAGRELSVSELIELMKERIHPSRRKP